MDPSSPPQRSRRERPAKSPLSRDAIVDAAMRVLEQEGIGKVTMRRVAAELDTGAASLYVYVRDTEDLHAQLLDGLLGRLRPLRPRGTWREKLEQVLEKYIALLYAYPEIARMAMSRMASGPNAVALIERLLSLLLEGGVPDREAAWAVDLLLLFSTAHAAEHGAWKEAGGDGGFADMATALRTADAATHPSVARLAGELISGGPERLRFHLDVLLNGVLATKRVRAEKKR